MQYIEKSFESFVTSNSNRVAYNSCLAVSSAGSNSGVEPLYIYGKNGVGKTHLLHAIEKKLVADDPNAKIIRKPVEQFMNEMISAIRYGKAEKFREIHRNCDALLLDDLSTIEGKKATQEELFHTLNQLVENGSKIVISSLENPNKMADIYSGIISRLNGGLVVEVGLPELELRLEILKSMAIRMKIGLPETVAKSIAAIENQTPSDLKGRLLQLNAFSNLNGTMLTV